MKKQVKILIFTFAILIIVLLLAGFMFKHYRTGVKISDYFEIEKLFNEKSEEEKKFIKDFLKTNQTLEELVKEENQEVQREKKDDKSEEEKKFIEDFNKTSKELQLIVKNKVK